jgi:DNA-binding phage protein
MQAVTPTHPEIEARPIGALVKKHGGITTVARQAGLTMPHLWMIVNGRRNPTYATRLKMARVFQCRIDEMTFPADTEQS